MYAALTLETDFRISTHDLQVTRSQPHHCAEVCPCIIEIHYEIRISKSINYMTVIISNYIEYRYCNLL